MGQARNICLVGHSGCGKTTLAAALMTRAGVKDLAFDSSHEEKERGYTIDMTVGTFKAKDISITLIDTPGGDEFVEEMYKGVPVADLTLIVLHAEKGVEVSTERAWEITGVAKRPTAILINQMDRENAKFEVALASVRDHFDGKFVPLQVPIRENGVFVGVVDLLENEAVYFGNKSKKDIPADLADFVEESRGALIEEISSFDDELMMKFLEEEPITPHELATTLAHGLAAGELVPVLCSSATEGKGLDVLLHTITEAVEQKIGSASAPTRAVAFHLSSDPYLGRLAVVKVIDGAIQEGKSLYDVVTGTKIEIRDIYAFEGTKQHRVTRAEVGQIVALGKADDVVLASTLGAEKGLPAYEMATFPRPVYSRAITPRTQADVEKMSEALREISTTKGTVLVGRDPVTKEMILEGMGDIHLSLVIERMKNRYNVTLDTHRPTIPYKETIRKQATARYRHKKQSGGRGQFGECELRLDPFEDGYQFLDEIKGASIPGQYVPGVEKGVIEAMEEGNLAKYPVTNVSVAVFDGSYHPVDSSELAFKMAGRHAFRDAFDKANPCLLEPIMHVDVRVPEEFTGDIISDMNGRRGRILGMEPEGKATIIRAEAPLSEMQSYSLDLKSRTQGRATFQMAFAKYQPVPGNVQEKVIAQAKQEEE
ncbi:elongation factor G [Candidatus Bipolaricaulota bacterium]|nr:elongation factor G [Candidatus Bipolaricaulota bacterium]